MVSPTPEVSMLASEPNANSVRDILNSTVPELKAKIPDIKIPTIVVSVADTPRSKAEPISAVTPRVRTPTYGSPRLSQMTPTPPTLKLTPKYGSKAVPLSDQDVGKPALPKVSEGKVNTETTKVTEKPTEAKMSLLERIKKQKLEAVLLKNLLKKERLKMWLSHWLNQKKSKRNLKQRTLNLKRLTEWRQKLAPNRR